MEPVSNVEMEDKVDEVIDVSDVDEVIDVSDVDEVIDVSDDDEVIDVSDDDEDVCVRVVQGGQEHDFSLSRYNPVFLRFERGTQINVDADITKVPRDSLTTVAAQGHWDAASLAVMLLSDNHEISFERISSKVENPDYYIILN